MTKIRIAKVMTSNVDGPGRRKVLYTQGCPIRCPGCQNRHLWDPEGGEEWETDDLAAVLLDSGLPVTISGGEPMLQADAVADLLATLRLQAPELHVIVYSGFVLQDLLKMAQAIPSIEDVLMQADILVDGPYLAELDHDKVQWRGSSNQRPINLHRTAWYGREIVRLEREDWDSSQTLTVDLDGDVIGTAGTMRELFDDTSPTRMCGQTAEAQMHDAWMRGVTDSILDRQTNPYATGPERRAWEYGWRTKDLGS
jgi:anaerobic ribonucleoside-triphosphate reductase activating protein